MSKQHQATLRSNARGETRTSHPEEKRRAPDPWRRIGSTRELASSWLKQRPDIDHPDIFRLSLYIMRLGRAVVQSYDRTCQDVCGISNDDMRVLFALRRASPLHALRQIDLSRELSVTSGAITKQVERLCRLGLVERAPSGSRKSTRLLTKLTRKGSRLADVAATHLTKNSPFADAALRLSAADRRAGLHFFDLILEEMER